MKKTQKLLRISILLALVGCADTNKAPATAESGAADKTQVPASTAGATQKTDAPKPQEAAAPAAEIGKPAPAFALKDLDGKSVELASFKGKTVVLEWFNPECPFVKKSHGDKGSLKGTAKRFAAKDVVWLSVNSGAPGKQGAGAETNKAGKSTFGMENPILLDEEGKVGKLYGATNTPHMFVIDKTGVLAYAGAIDNSPDGEGESPEGGKLVNYVEQAIGELDAGKPVSVSRTKAYGCSVKYGS